MAASGATNANSVGAHRADTQTLPGPRDVTLVKYYAWANTHGMRHTLFQYPRDAAYPRDADHTAVVTHVSGDAHPTAITVTVMSSFTGEKALGPLQVQADRTVVCLHRQLQWLWCETNPTAALVRLMFLNPENVLDPSLRMRHLLQPLGSGCNQKELVLQMITEPVLLSWEQLCAMSAMRKHSRRGGRGAWLKQRELRVYCFRNHIRQFDLSADAYDWRLLLKTIDENYRRRRKHQDAPSLRMQTVIGRGVISFQFRLLDLIDPNYRVRDQTDLRLAGYGSANGVWLNRDDRSRHVEDIGERHVFEICCADGIRWHMHFHSTGSCDLMRRSHFSDN